MRPDSASSKRRIGSRNQILKSEEELKRSPSIGAKKCVALRYVSSPHMPASLLPYAPTWSTGSGSSEAGSSRPRPPSPSSDSSGYHHCATPRESDNSDESDGEKVIPRDFVDSDEAEQRVVARLLRRSECFHMHAVAKKEAELVDALRLMEHQEAEEREVERLRRQQAEKAEVINLD